MPIVDTLPNGFYRPQIDAAVKIWINRRHLLADQPGAGKTLQALLALELDGMFSRRANILILCTVTACQLTWGPEVKRRVATQYDVHIADTTDTHGKVTMPSLAKRNAMVERTALEAQMQNLPLIVVANFDCVHWAYGKTPAMPALFDIEWDAIIVDESHLVLPTRSDVPADLTNFQHGLYNLSTRPDTMRIAMSGTPDRGKLENRYGTWKWLFPTLGFNDYWKWVRANFMTYQGEWGGLTIGRVLDVAKWNSFSHKHMTRRTKKEMLKGLPDKLWAGDGGIDLPMTPLQQEAYENYQADVEATYAQLSSSEDPADVAKAQGIRLSFALRARQMGVCLWDFPAVGATGAATPIVAGTRGSAKLSWILEFLSTRGHKPGLDQNPEGGKVVIVSYFVEILKWLKEELAAAGFTAEILSGDTPAPRKLATEEAFQRGALRIVLLSGHLGVSINLDAADDMIFTDLVHDPDRMEQAEDRIHRASRIHQVTYWRLLSEGTMDVAIVREMDVRYRTTRTSYDGSRGVEFARKFLGGPQELEMAS